MAERRSSSRAAGLTWAGEDAAQLVAGALSQLQQHLHQEVLKAVEPAHGEIGVASAAAVSPAVIKANPLLCALQRCSRQLAKLRDSLLAQAREFHWTEARRLGLAEEGRRAQSALLHAQQLAKQIYQGSLAQLDGAFGGDPSNHCRLHDTIESCDGATAVTAAALSSVISALSNFPSRPSQPRRRSSSDSSSSSSSSSSGGGGGSGGSGGGGDGEVGVGGTGIGTGTGRNARPAETRTKRRTYPPRLPGKGEPFQPASPASGPAPAGVLAATTATRRGHGRGIFSSGSSSGSGGSGARMSSVCDLGRGICRSASARSCRSQAAAATGTVDPSGGVWGSAAAGKAGTAGRVRGAAAAQAAWGERSTTATATETAVALGLAPVTRARVHAAEEARERALHARPAFSAGGGGSGGPGLRLADGTSDDFGCDGGASCPEMAGGEWSGAGAGAGQDTFFQGAAGGGKLSPERSERRTAGGGGPSAAGGRNRAPGDGLEESLWAERRGHAGPAAREYVGDRPSRRSPSPALASPDQSARGAPFGSAASSAAFAFEDRHRMAAGAKASEKFRTSSSSSSSAAAAVVNGNDTLGRSSRIGDTVDGRGAACGGSQEDSGDERLVHAFLGDADLLSLLRGGADGGDTTTPAPAATTTRARSPTGPLPRRTLGAARAATAASASRRRDLLDRHSASEAGGSGEGGRRGGRASSVARRSSATSHAASTSRAAAAAAAAASSARRSQSTGRTLLSSPRQLRSVGCFVAARAVGAAAAAAAAALEAESDGDEEAGGGAQGNPQGVDDDEAAARRIARQEQEVQAREDELLAMRIAAREEAHAERRAASRRRRSSSSSRGTTQGRRRLHLAFDNPGGMVAANAVLAAAMAAGGEAGGGGGRGGSNGNVSDAVRALQFQDIDENDFETLLALDEAGGEGGRSCAGGRGLTEDAVEGVLQSATAAGKRLEESCAICMVDFELGDEISILPCLHAFHGECIRKWLLLRNRCPTDMQPVVPDSPAGR